MADNSGVWLWFSEGKEEDVGLWLHPEAKLPPLNIDAIKEGESVRERVCVRLLTTQFPKLTLWCLKSPFLGRKANIAFSSIV